MDLKKSPGTTESLGNTRCIVQVKHSDQEAGLLLKGLVSCKIPLELDPDPSSGLNGVGA